MELTRDQLDALTELMNIGVAKAAGVLNEMLEARIHLRVPSIKTLTVRELQQEMGSSANDKLAAVQLGFRGAFSGTSALAFPTDSASKLVSVLTEDEAQDEDPSDLDSIRVGTLTEVGNIVMNGVMGSIGNILEERIDYAVPSYIEDTVTNLLTSNVPDTSATVIVARTQFSIEQLQISGDVMLFFEVGSFDALLASIETMIERDSED
ncbi:MAG: chemotaxis protein CheX [Proteobacteria bacterium]|nr:chemotaxis protein CheX [Pseudomonadota bacterium]